MNKIKEFILVLIAIVVFVVNLNSQIVKNTDGTIQISDKVYFTKVIDGDTVILATLDTIILSSPRIFKSAAEKKLYKKYKQYCTKVYPYAQDAINILNKMEERTKRMSPRRRQRYINLTYKQLESNFKVQLKKLSRTQGKLLIKMIEKETNMSFYNIIKKMRSGFTAFYWHNLGKLYGYDLKEGYTKGKDPIMDTVFQDFRFNKKDDGILNSSVIKNKN